MGRVQTCIPNDNLRKCFRKAYDFYYVQHVSVFLLLAGILVGVMKTLFDMSHLYHWHVPERKLKYTNVS